jgi:electron transport complex protein RnfG
MRETLRLSLILALIAALCGALLVALASKTAPARAATGARKRLAAVQSVLATAGGDTLRFEAAGDAEAADADAFVAFAPDGAFAGAAIVGASAHGYGGEVRLMVGFGADGRLLDFAVVEGHETPGLGAKIARDDFRAGFRGRPFDGVWKVRKDGGEIDAVTSATISSRAATEAVADAASRFAALRDAAAGK